MSKDLLTAGKELIKLFNDVAEGTSKDYDYLVTKMTTDVVLKRVVHQGTCPVGKDNLRLYLNRDMKPLRPRLDYSPGTLIAHPKSNTKETYGLVSGTGDYYDGDSTTKVSFTLSFVRNSDSDDWLLDRGFAGPD